MSFRVSLLRRALCIVLGFAATRPVAAQLGHTFAFFPPTPPLLGAVVPENQSTFTHNGQNIVAPDALAEDVGEVFYLPLGTLLHERTFTSRQKTRLKDYHARRLTLLNELTSKIDELRAAAPADREAALIAFARQQTPRVVALEDEAEKLRKDFLTAATPDSDEMPLAVRRSRLPSAIARQEARIVRLAAFQEEGLLVEQRGLLLELYKDMQWEIRSTTGMTSPFPANRTTFSPATSSFLLRPDRTAALDAKVVAYERDKQVLKTELRATVIRLATVDPDDRARGLKDLAKKQAVALDALESQAEEIRRGLAALPGRKLSMPVKLPAALAQRIDDYQAEFHALLQSFPKRAREASAQRAQGASAAEVLGPVIKAERERMLELQRTKAAIRDELQHIAQTLTDPDTGQPYSAAKLLDRYIAAEAAFEELGREDVIYKNYRAAMLEPGLSAPQRRILFTAAVAGLAMPLPGPVSAGPF